MTKHDSQKTLQAIDRGIIINEDYIMNFQNERNIQDSTMECYWSSLALYLPLCGFSTGEEMIQEALEDERNHVPIKESRIADHLRAYMRYLNEAINTNGKPYSNNTKHTYFTKIETFYRHYSVTVPNRPPMKLEKEYHVNYYDLPTKKMIETAINQSKLMCKAIFYFMSSSGTAKAETLNLTVGDFIQGLHDYTDSTDPEQVVKELHGRKDLVPIISMLRLKTNVPYFTCCSPEATYFILEYIKVEKRYNPNDQLFGCNGSYLMKKFQIINDRNNWGRVGNYRKFRAHTLRKFHASNLGASFELINTLEGRTNGVIHETYVKQKPDEIKTQYMQYMHNVMIHPENFEGPGCGFQSQHVPKSSSMNTQQQLSQQNMQNVDVAVYKEIGKLELRIEELERKIKELGG